MADLKTTIRSNEYRNHVGRLSVTKMIKEKSSIQNTIFIHGK